MQTKVLGYIALGYVFSSVPPLVGALQAGAGSALFAAEEDESHDILQHRAGEASHVASNSSQGPEGLDMYGMPRDTMGIPEVTGTQTSANLFVMLSFAYLIACVCYEFFVPEDDKSKDGKDAKGREQGSSAAQAALPRRPEPAETTPLAATESPGSKIQQKRVMEWDFAKLVLIFFVIMGHINMFVGHVIWLSYGWTGSVFMHFPTTWVMSGFVFVSGVFGQAVGKTRLARVFCYTIITAGFLELFRWLLTHATNGPPDFGFTALIWYLVCLFVWRFTVTPAFVFTRAYGLPGPVFLVLLTIVSYRLHHMHPWGLFGDFWQYIVVFAPFFGLGLLRTPAEWTSLMENYVYLFFLIAAAWYGCLTYWPMFREQPAVQEISCWTGFADACRDAYFPNTFTPPEMSLEDFGRDVRRYSLKSIVTVSMLSVLFAVFRLLSSIAPSLAAKLADFGERTLYGYLLHMLFFSIAAVRMGFAEFYLPIPTIGPDPIPIPGMEDLPFPMPPVPADSILPQFFTRPQEPWARVCWLHVFIGFAVLFIWTSRLTEKIFQPVIFPLWVLNFVPGGFGISNEKKSSTEQ